MEIIWLSPLFLMGIFLCTPDSLWSQQEKDAWILAMGLFQVCILGWEACRGYKTRWEWGAAIERWERIRSRASEPRWWTVARARAEYEAKMLTAYVGSFVSLALVVGSVLVLYNLGLLDTRSEMPPDLQSLWIDEWQFVVGAVGFVVGLALHPIIYYKIISALVLRKRLAFNVD